jgi:hypothetical protein
MAIKLHIKGARLSFANGLFRASSLEPGQTEKFGADFIITPQTEVLKQLPDGSKVKTTLKAAMLEVANETWKGKGQAMLDALEPSKKCYRNGDTKVDKSGEVRDGYAGNWYITAKNVKRPGTFAKDGTPVTESDGVIYSGCHVYAIVELYGNAVPTKKGVFASLLGVRFEADGESFGGGSTARADDFEPATDGADAEEIA